MREIKSVAVVGAGALGLMYFELIQKKLKGECYFMAEGDRLNRLNKTLYDINGAKKSFKALDPRDTPIHPDLIVVAVKNYHLESVLPLIEAASNEGTVIFSLLNGIGSEEILEHNTPAATVLYAMALGMDAVKVESRLTFTSRGRIVLGSKHNNGLAALGGVASFLESCGIEIQISKDIHKDLWFKWMINIGINQTSALAGASYKWFQKDNEFRTLMNDAMAETIAVAQAEGIDLGAADLDRWYAVLDGLGGAGKTSMVQDIEAGRRTEVDSFAGELIERAQARGIEVPVNRTLYSLIKVKEALSHQNL